MAPLQHNAARFDVDLVKASKHSATTTTATAAIATPEFKGGVSSETSSRKDALADSESKQGGLKVLTLPSPSSKGESKRDDSNREEVDLEPVSSLHWHSFKQRNQHQQRQQNQHQHKHQHQQLLKQRCQKIIHLPFTNKQPACPALCILFWALSAKKYDETCHG